jgi:hypothetical protein
MLCTCLATSFAFAANQESIVVDSNGDYVFTYQGYLGWQKVTWIPATKINPAVRVFVRPVTGTPDNISYSYTVRNGKDSRQFVVGLNLLASNVLSSDARSPDGWSGGAVLDHAAGAGFIVGWFFRRYGGPWEAGIKPGTAVNGFGFDSKDLPGVGKVELGGAVPGGQSFPDEGPNEDSQILREFNRILDNDFVTRLAAIPRIPNPTPFNAVVVLGGIQKHVKTDMVSMQLIDPALLAAIDRGLTQAIAAAQGGNTPSLLHEIMSLRKLLKQEHADVDKDDDSDRDDDKDKKTKPRIDKLAARVLDFDLKYVEKRVK